MSSITGTAPPTDTRVADVGIQVLFFGALRERLGRTNVTISEAADTVAEVWDLATALAAGSGVSRDGILCARNLEHCGWSTEVHPGDEVAFMPPVSGGAGADDDGVTVAVTDTTIDLADLLTRSGTDEDGAVACFIGKVRNHNEGAAVSGLDYEAYRPMALSVMRRIAIGAKLRHGLSSIAIVHRVGELTIADAAVVVITSSAHRAPALQACREVIDAVKHEVPIWKREHTTTGARWLDARDTAEVRV